MVPKDWSLESVAAPMPATNSTRAVLTPSTDLGSKDPSATTTTTTTTTDSKSITGTSATSAPAPRSNSAVSALPATLLAVLLAALALLL
jgi:hypothetical protein